MGGSDEQKLLKVTISAYSFDQENGISVMGRVHEEVLCLCQHCSIKDDGIVLNSIEKSRQNLREIGKDIENLFSYRDYLSLSLVKSFTIN